MPQYVADRDVGPIDRDYTAWSESCACAAAFHAGQLMARDDAEARERAQVIARYKAGAPLYAIAREMHIAYAAVVAHAAYVPGFKPRGRHAKVELTPEILGDFRRRYVDEFFALEEAARAAGVPYKRADEALQLLGLERRKPVPRADRERAVRFYLQGLPVAEIAKRLATAERTIHRWVKDAGVPLRYSRTMSSGHHYSGTRGTLRGLYLAAPSPLGTPEK